MLPSPARRLPAPPLPALLLSALLVGCLPVDPGLVLIAPDLDRSGEPGAQGPHGAAMFRHEINVGVDQATTVEVVFPGDEAGRVDIGGPYPLVALVQGGAVDLPRYRWLSSRLATRGYVVVAAEHPLDLALFSSENTLAAVRAADRWSGQETVIRGAVDLDADAAVLGHSLGGVVASSAWVQADRLSHVGILASYPADFTPVEEGTGAVLSITGDADGLTSVAEAQDGWARFPGPGLFAVVEGMTHFDWTDGNSDADLARDGSPGRPTADSRDDAMVVVDSFLDAFLRADASSRAAFDGADFDGVQEER